MKPLLIELDTETLRAAENAARKAGCPLAEWASRCVENAAALSERGWPDGYFEQLSTFSDTDLQDVEEVAVPLDDVVISPAES